jgi:AraC-like DNA-binding protein
MRPGNEFSASLPGLDVIFHNRPDQKWERHEHSRHELIVPLAGEIICSGKISGDLRVKRGEMLWIELGVPHVVKSSHASGESLILLMESDFWCQQRKGITVSAGNQLLIELAMWLIFRREDHNQSTITAALKSVIATLGSSEPTFNLIHSEHSSRIRDVRLIKALQFMEQNSDRELRVAEIAKACGASERTLDRLANAELGKSIGETLRTIRVEQAVQLLQNGLNVTETALRVGYQSLSQFIRVFQNSTGRLPSDFLR